MTLVVVSTDELRELINTAVREAIGNSHTTSSQPNGKGWLNINDAAECCDVSRGTINAWIIDGTIPEWARLPRGRTHRISAHWCAGSRTPR